MDNQLTDLRAQVARMGGGSTGRFPRMPSPRKRKRVAVPDGTFGYRVVHRNGERFDGAAGGECNGLMVPDSEQGDA